MSAHRRGDEQQLGGECAQPAAVIRVLADMCVMRVSVFVSCACQRTPRVRDAVVLRCMRECVDARPVCRALRYTRTRDGPVPVLHLGARLVHVRALKQGGFLHSCSPELWTGSS